MEMQIHISTHHRILNSHSDIRLAGEHRDGDATDAIHLQLELAGPEVH